MTSCNESLIGMKKQSRDDCRLQSVSLDSSILSSSSNIHPINKLLFDVNFGISNVVSEEDLDKKTLLLQNQMLLQRLREYSSIDKDVQIERNLISGKRNHYNHNYNYIKTVWQSLNSDLKSLLCTFSNRSPLPSNSNIQDDSTSDDDFSSCFQIVSPNVNFFRSSVANSFEKIEEDLTITSKLSRDFVDKLLELFTQQRRISQILTVRLNESTSPFDSISFMRDEITKLHQENNRLLSQIQNLYNDASCAEEKSLILQLQLNNVNDQISEYEESSVDLKFDLDRARNKISKLEHRLSAIMHNQSFDKGINPDNNFSFQKESESLTSPPRSSNCDDTQLRKKEEHEEWRFLAETRLQEVEELQKMLCDIKTEMETRTLVGKLGQNVDIKFTALYRSLQTQYTLVCACNIQLKNQCDELKKILKTCKQQYTSQLSDLLDIQSRLKKEALDEISRLDQELFLSRRDCDTLRLDYDGRNSCYEQALLSSKELEATISSLRNNLRQVKQDLNRYRNLASDAQNLADSLQEEKTNEREKYEMRIASNQNDIFQLKDNIHDLRNKLKDLEEEEGEVKDHRKPGPSVEILDLKRQLDEKNRELSKRREDYEQRIQSRTQPLKEEIIYLRQQLQSRKQEQDLFMKEMDVTGQAYEDEQERVSSLLKQIKEKDDANFKLMTERIKLNQLQKRMNEEREVFQKQGKVFRSEGSSLKEVTNSLDERDRKFEISLLNLEKESDLNDQIIENYKKKAYESTQELQDTKFKLEEVLHQMNHVEKALLSKTVEYEVEIQKSRRFNEEFSIQRKKLDKLKKQQLSFTDEILLEEIKSYKAELTCPCCSQRKKDHVLTKCFHVFCGECIKMRYETRQRKCPKCNANFGNNDWHKIYLT